MATTRWRISGWESGSCPEKAFRKDSDLLIFQEEGSDTSTLVWMSGADESRLCWIDNLPLVPSEDPILVHFGTEKIYCVVSVIRQGKLVLGTLRRGDRNEGDAGTFAASANGPFIRGMDAPG